MAAPEESPTATVARALQALYHGTDEGARREAAAWLENFQRTPEAWQVADTLLNTPAFEGRPGAEVEIWYFAAQTLRTKMQHDFAQLPPESLPSLRDSLLAHVAARAAGPATVLTQLCLALACLAVHMPAWEQPIQDVYARLGHEPATLRALLSFFTVLPEQASDPKIGVPPSRRRAFCEMLAAAAKDVFRLLLHVQGAGGAGSDAAQTLTCFRSWLLLCATAERGSEGRKELMAVSEPLLRTALEALSQPHEEAYEVAVDVAVEAVRFMTGDPEGWGLEEAGPEGADAPAERVGRQAAAMASLLPWCGQLSPLLAEHIRTGDEDAARGLCRFFAELGEACAFFIVNGAAGQLPPSAGVPAEQAAATAAQVTQVLLRASAHPVPEVAEISFNFWYVCMIEICDRSDEPGRDAARAAWTPPFLQFAVALNGHMRMPPGAESWSADTHDDFRRFRYNCGDGLSDAAKVCGPEVVLQELCRPVFEALPGVEGDAAAQRVVEGGLQAARAVAPQAKLSQDEPVGSILAGVVRIPAGAPQDVRVAALLLLSALAPWLNHHPAHLSPALACVLGALPGPGDRVAAAACGALKDLCEACCEHLSAPPWAEELLRLVAGTAQLPLASQDRVDLIQGLGSVFSLMPLADVDRCLQAVAGPLLARLQQLCGGAPGAAAPPSSEVCACLDQLAAVARYTQPAVQEFAPLHPIGELLRAAWPSLCAVQARLPKDSRANEKMTRVLKFSIRTATTWAAPVAAELLPRVAAWFGEHPHSCYLYAVHNCVTVLSGTSPELDELLFGSYCALATAVARILAAPAGAVASGAPLEAHPDVLEDFFELSSLMLRRFPAGMLGSGEIWASLVSLASSCLMIQHREAWRACTNFVEVMLQSYMRRVDQEREAQAALAATVAAHGPLIARALVLGAAGVLPPSRVSRVATVLKTLLDAEPAQAQAWVAAACRELPAAVQEEAKGLLDALAQAATTGGDGRRAAEPIRRGIDNFSEVCRRLRIVAT